MNTLRKHMRAASIPSLIVMLLGFLGPVGAQDHSQHQQPPKKPTTEEPKQDAVDHAAMGHDQQTATMNRPREPIPALTDADRAAAFPDTGAGHAAHDVAVHSFLQLDQLEMWDADEGTGLSWEALGWIGGDINRAWLRSEGDRVNSHTEAADLELLWGRAISPWWDLVGGVRHDFEPGASQTFAGVGVIGLSPYKFEIEASAYLGESGQTTARIEAEYDLLLTNRLILQPLVEINLYGRDDEGGGIGSGLSTLEAGMRLRYEFARRFAPYVGVIHERAFSDTADFLRAEGEETRDTLIVAGIRTWF